jgi:membrane-bound lytic murein transglycosylase D
VEQGSHVDEVLDYLSAAESLLKDSLWFEGEEYLDDALASLLKAEEDARMEDPDSTESLKSQVEHDILRLLRDSVYTLYKQASIGSQSALPKNTWRSDWDINPASFSPAQLEDMRKAFKKSKSKHYDLPIETPLHPRILNALTSFTGPKRRTMEIWLNRRSRYSSMIRKKLQEKKMPQGLVYLSMIESGFQPRAHSRSAASGLWQFIQETGERYGLESDWWIDERRDPEKATDAALKYLWKLHQEFQDWYLAMAAYNCGENRIRRLLKEDSTQTYWDMDLPRETMNYVPSILAAMIIGQNPTTYGFTLDPEPDRVYDTVTVHHALTLSTVGKLVGVSEGRIRELNPELRRVSISPGIKEYVLKVPAGTRDLFQQGYQKLPSSSFVRWHRHRVRRGETLGHIAARYGVSVGSLKQANKLKSPLIRIGQNLLVPVPEYASRQKSHLYSLGGPTYRVQPGDNLYSIAKAYRLSLERLMKYNGLHSKSVLKPGQILYLDFSTKKNKPRKNRKGLKGDYRVQEGDNLGTIALRLGVTVHSLMKWNDLKTSRIKIGQTLYYSPVSNPLIRKKPFTNESQQEKSNWFLLER